MRHPPSPPQSNPIHLPSRAKSENTRESKLNLCLLEEENLENRICRDIFSIKNNSVFFANIGMPVDANVIELKKCIYLQLFNPKNIYLQLELEEIFFQPWINKNICLYLANLSKKYRKAVRWCASLTWLISLIWLIWMIWLMKLNDNKIYRLSKITRIFRSDKSLSSK